MAASMALRYAPASVVSPQLLELDDLAALEGAPRELDGTAVGLPLAVGLHRAPRVVELLEEGARLLVHARREERGGDRFEQRGLEGLARLVPVDDGSLPHRWDPSTGHDTGHTESERGVQPV
eukprot:4998506-Prymnesium_polylepis.1